MNKNRAWIWEWDVFSGSRRDGVVVSVCSKYFESIFKCKESSEDEIHSIYVRLFTKYVWDPRFRAQYWNKNKINLLSLLYTITTISTTSVQDLGHSITSRKLYLLNFPKNILVFFYGKNILRFSCMCICFL